MDADRGEIGVGTSSNGSMASNGEGTSISSTKYRNGSSNGFASNGKGAIGGDGTMDDDDDGEDADMTMMHASTSSLSQVDRGPKKFNPIYPGSLIDREELVRLTLQCLQDAGYT